MICFDGFARRYVENEESRWISQVRDCRRKKQYYCNNLDTADTGQSRVYGYFTLTDDRRDYLCISVHPTSRGERKSILQYAQRTWQLCLNKCHMRYCCTGICICIAGGGGFGIHERAESVWTAPPYLVVNRKGSSILDVTLRRKDWSCQ